MSRTQPSESLLCSLGWHAVTPFPHYNNGFYFAKCRRCGNDLVRTTYSGWHIPAGHRIVWQREAPDRAPQPAIATDDVSTMIGRLEQREAAELIAARLGERPADPPPPPAMPAMPAEPPKSAVKAAPLAAVPAAAAAVAAPGEPAAAAADAHATDTSGGPAPADDTAPTPPAVDPVPTNEQAASAAPDAASDITADPATPAGAEIAATETSPVLETQEASAGESDATPADADAAADPHLATTETGAGDGPEAEGAVVSAADSLGTDPASPTEITDEGVAPDTAAAADSVVSVPDAADSLSADADHAPEAGSDDSVADDAEIGESTATEADDAGEQVDENGEPKSLVPDFMDNPWPISQITEIAAQRPREPDVTLMTMSGPPLTPPAPDGGASAPAPGTIDPTPMARQEASSATAPTTQTPPASGATGGPSLEGLGLASLDRLSNNVERPGRPAARASASSRAANAPPARTGRGWMIAAVAAIVAALAAGGWAISEIGEETAGSPVGTELGTVGPVDPRLAPEASTPGAAAGVAFIDARRLNCRAQPTRSAASVAILERGRRVRVTAERGDWSSLAVVGGSVCWTQSRFLSDTPPA